MQVLVFIFCFSCLNDVHWVMRVANVRKHTFLVSLQARHCLAYGFLKFLIPPQCCKPKAQEHNILL